MSESDAQGNPANETPAPVGVTGARLRGNSLSKTVEASDSQRMSLPVSPASQAALIGEDSKRTTPLPSGAASHARSSSSVFVEPTTRTEILGWWMYMAAVEPISIVVLQLFLPSLFTLLGLRVGHVRGTLQKCTKDDMAEGMCIVANVFGIDVTSNTYSYGIIAFSVLIQAVLFLCFGALADYGGMRKRLLVIVTVLGAALCLSILVPVSEGSLAMWHGAQNVLITLVFGIAIMLYNSYLPLLAAGHPETTSFRSDDPVEMAHRREVVASSLSSKSFMFGYGSGALLLLLLIAYSFAFKPDEDSLLTGGIACTGVYWLAVAIFPLFALKPRRGPSIPRGASYLTFSVRKTFATMRKWRRLPHTFRFLVAYFLFADGCNTMGTIAVIFAKSILRADQLTLILCSLLAPVCGVAGNLLLFRIQRRLRLPSKTMLLGVLAGLAALGCYSSTGIVSQSFGLRNKWELYPVACVYGFLMGAMQSFSRVLFGELIPPGEESEFFALYAITDKGASWLGPAIQAIVGSLEIDQRWGIVALVLMIVAPFPLLVWRVDGVQGKQDALRYIGVSDDVVAKHEDAIE